MSLPDRQSGRDKDRQSSFVFKNVTIADINYKDTFYMIEPIDKMHNFYLKRTVLCDGQTGRDNESRYLIVEKFSKTVKLDHIA